MTKFAKRLKQKKEDTAMRSFFTSLLCIVLASCGENFSTLPPPVPIGTVNGVAHDSEMSGSTVEVRAFVNGQAGDILGTGITDQHGSFSVSVQTEEKALLIEVKDGYYVEEATGATVNLASGKKIRAVVGYSTGATVNSVVTFFTNLAAGLAEYRIKQGMDATTAISSSQRDIRALLNFDISQTVPRNITNLANVTSYPTNEYSYGFIGAAVSSWTAYASSKSGEAVHSSLNSIAFAEKAYDDIRADGLLDGFALDTLGALAPISFGVIALNQNIYRHGIAAHVISMVNSANNKTSLTETQLLAFATAYAGSASTVFGGVEPLPFSNCGRPVVAFTSPAPNQVVGGMVSVTASASSQGTIVSANLSLDSVPTGSAPVTASAAVASAPTFTIFVGSESPDPNSFTATVVDFFGLSASATMPIRIDKTTPTLILRTVPPGGVIWNGDYSEIGSGINKVVAVYKDGYSYNATLKATSATSGTWSIPWANNGFSPASISATDNAGNTCTSTTSSDYWGSNKTICQ